MCDGVIGANAICLVDVEGTHTLLLGDFEEVCSVRGIPSTDDKDEVEIEFIGSLHEIVDCVLPLLSFYLTMHHGSKTVGLLCKDDQTKMRPVYILLTCVASQIVSNSW